MRGVLHEVPFVEDLHEILATGRSRTRAIDREHPAQWSRSRGYDPGVAKRPGEA